MAHIACQPDPYDQIALHHVICPTCGAARGSWCTTKGGTTAFHLHTPRQQAVRMAYALGYTDRDKEAR